MVEAIVQDTGSHLANLESKREALESALAEGKEDDVISICTQQLVEVIKDYKNAAGHVKKHCAKPKVKKPKAIEDAAQGPDLGGSA